MNFHPMITKKYIYHPKLKSSNSIQKKIKDAVVCISVPKYYFIHACTFFYDFSSSFYFILVVHFFFMTSIESAACCSVFLSLQCFITQTAPLNLEMVCYLVILLF